MKKKSFLMLAVGALVIPSLLLLTSCGDKGTKPYKINLEGEGTSASPYLIGTAANLDVLTKDVKIDTTGKYFKLTSNIDDYTTGSTTHKNIFKGILDGDGKTITFDGNTGLFVTNTGTISNLNITGTLTAGGTGIVGMLANENQGAIKNVATSGEVVSTRGTLNKFEDVATFGVGALVGKNATNATIKNVTNEATVKALVGGAGIAAVNYGTIEQGFNTGSVGEENRDITTGTNKYSYIGGINAVNYGTIKGCSNKEFIFATALTKLAADAGQIGNEYVGGISAYNSANAVITECTNTFGQKTVNEVKQSYTTFGDKYVGGIAGYTNGEVSYSINNQNIGGREYFAAIAGWVGETGTVNGCFGNAQAFGSTFATIEEAEAANFYAIANKATNSVYNAASELRGQAPVGDNNISGLANSGDATAALAVLNTGLTAGQEKMIAVINAGNANPVVQPRAVVSIATFYKSASDTEPTVFNVGKFDTKEIKFPTVTAPEGKVFAGWVTNLEDASNTLIWSATDTGAKITETVIVYAYFTDAPAQA